MDLGSILSGPFGALFGAVGAIGGKIIDYKMTQLSNEHQLAMRDKDMAQARMEAEAKYEVTKLEGDTALAVKDLDNIGMSFASDKATYGESTIGHIVDFARGVIRPLITASAMVLVAYMTVRAIGDGVVFNAEQRMEVIQESLFLSGTAITWWFGTRTGRTSRKV